MAEGQDVEISLGTGRLLALFFGLVAICAVFFGFGYSLGRTSGTATMTAQAASPAVANTAVKPKAGNSQPDAAPSPSSSDLTFYKTVEQKDAPAQLTPAAASAPAPSNFPSAEPQTAAPAPDAARSSGYVVQVAAVTKKEDAEALMAALRKKSYPVFVVSNTPTDNFYHVQVGPFSDIRDAEAMRTRLSGEGYSPIVKK